MSIRHVLFDADGVVQELPGGWEVAFAPFLAEPGALFERLSMDEQACIRGEGPFLPVLADHLRALGVTTPAQVVYDAVWSNIEVSSPVVSLVEQLRAGGLGVHLATNQNPERAAYMRAETGHDDLFDRSFYSCELGTAKPDPEFFRHILEEIEAEAGEVCFIDDSERNVAAARELGIAAEQWQMSDGIVRLRELLLGCGIRLP